MGGFPRFFLKKAYEVVGAQVGYTQQFGVRKVFIVMVIQIVNGPEDALGSACFPAVHPAAGVVPGAAKQFNNNLGADAIQDIPVSGLLLARF